MATAKELALKVSEILGVAENTVILHDRNLALAELRSMAGRGRAAARMTSLDAAHLLIAVAASRTVKDSAATVRLYSSLVADSTMSFQGEGDGQDRGQTFVDAIAALLEIVPLDPDAFSGVEGDNIIVAMWGPGPKAKITIQKAGHNAKEFNYRRPWQRGESAQPVGDLEFIAQFTQVTLGHVGTLVATDR